MKIGALEKELRDLRPEQREELLRSISSCLNLLPEQLIQEMGLRTLRDLIVLVQDRILREAKNREAHDGREYHDEVAKEG